MLKKQIESLLFISNKSLSIDNLAKFCDCGKVEVETVLESLQQEYNQKNKGINILECNNRFQMVTNKDSSNVIEKFLKQELTGEMTRPQLETLTIIAYREPITKIELEQIRGVNCSLILRNLMIRGLVSVRLDKKIKTTVYEVTEEFIRHLGMTSIKDLPDYEKLSKHETLVNFLEKE